VDARGGGGVRGSLAGRGLTRWLRGDVRLARGLADELDVEVIDHDARSGRLGVDRRGCVRRLWADMVRDVGCGGGRRRRWSDGQRRQDRRRGQCLVRSGGGRIRGRWPGGPRLLGRWRGCVWPSRSGLGVCRCGRDDDVRRRERVAWRGRRGRWRRSCGRRHGCRVRADPAHRGDERRRSLAGLRRYRGGGGADGAGRVWGGEGGLRRRGLPMHDDRVLQRDRADGRRCRSGGDRWSGGFDAVCGGGLLEECERRVGAEACLKGQVRARRDRSGQRLRAA
jgi:hypothetical protein